jgi:hypothetical protein
MSDDFYFDPDQQEGSNFELIPVGDYTAEIIEAAITQPRSGDGQMLKLTWKITDGEYAGRQLWQTLCYLHSNQQAQDIARRTLKDLCVALDIREQITDPEVFKYKPARVRVIVEKDKSGQYDDQNRIRRVRSLTEANNEAAEAKEAKTAKPAKSAPPKPAGNGPGAAPWKQPRA